MNYTNIHNLPEHIQKWCAADEYDHIPGVISATTLISPARAYVLKKRHEDRLTMDYSDMLKLRLGSAIHDSLEKVGVFGDGDFREKRFCAECMGFQITGKPDAVIAGVIRDNKSTSVWKFVKKDFADYVKQLSIYRWILQKNGIETAEYAFIDFFFTDWKKSDAQKGGDYPPILYQEQRIELMTLDETEKFIEDRLAEFIFAEGSLPDCTKEELWTRDEKFAVMKNPAALKAMKLFDEEKEANQFAADNGAVVVHRPGKAVRCGYCTAAPFCEQFQRLKAEGLIDD